MSWEVERYKKGKRWYGWFLKNKSTGVAIYVARRSHKEIFRSGESLTSEALRKDIACWAIDNETIQLCRIKGVKFIGVKVKDTESIYLTKIEEFYDPVNMKIKNYSLRGGSLQRYVPISRFKVKQKIKI